MSEQTTIEEALNTLKAARFLGLTPGSLTVMRSRGSGPPAHYSGKRPVYYISELKHWQADCTAAMEKKREQRDSKKLVASA